MVQKVSSGQMRLLAASVVIKKSAWHCSCTIETIGLHFNCSRIDRSFASLCLLLSLYQIWTFSYSTISHSQMKKCVIILIVYSHPSFPPSFIHSCCISSSLHRSSLSVIVISVSYIPSSFWRKSVVQFSLRTLSLQTPFWSSMFTLYCITYLLPCHRGFQT